MIVPELPEMGQEKEMFVSELPEEKKMIIPDLFDKPVYTCNWDPTNPQCIRDLTGLPMEECEKTCKTSTYGKCDYDKNTCEICTLGADKECVYPMNYC